MYEKPFWFVICLQNSPANDMRHYHNSMSLKMAYSVLEYGISVAVLVNYYVIIKERLCIGKTIRNNVEARHSHTNPSIAHGRGSGRYQAVLHTV
jgi:hypothetical protein